MLIFKSFAKINYAKLFFIINYARSMNFSIDTKKIVL